MAYVCSGGKVKFNGEGEKRKTFMVAMWSDKSFMNSEIKEPIKPPNECLGCIEKKHGSYIKQIDLKTWEIYAVRVKRCKFTWQEQPE